MLTDRKTRLETYLHVLETVRSGESEPAGIMFRCNLAWSCLSKVLDSLIEQELVRVNREENRRIYSITEKGRLALTYFRKLQGFLTLDRSTTHDHAESSLLQSRLFSDNRLSKIVVINIVRYYYRLS